MVNLVELVKDKFIQNVQAIHDDEGGSGWKVIVMDLYTLTLFQHHSELNELLNFNVKSVDLITDTRSASSKDSCIYFCMPTSENVDLILSDFTGTRKYKDAYLLFLTKIPNSLFKLLSGRCAKYWKGLKELYIDYLPLEQKVFSLELPQLFYSIYAAPKLRLDFDLKVIAKRILSVLITLGEMPLVRYHSLPGLDLNLNLATEVQGSIDRFLKDNPEFVPNKGHIPSELIILDRTIDLAQPLIHDLGYQSLATDVVGLDGGWYDYEYINGHQETIEERVRITEMDELWLSLRHSMISDVTEDLLNRFKSLINGNAAANNMMNRNEGQVPSVQEMRDVVESVPELQTLAKQISIHLNLTEKCLDAISQTELRQVIEAEQALTTGQILGEEDLLEPIISPLAIIAPLLNSLTLPIFLKLRLILCYIIYHHIKKIELSDLNLNKLLQHANLSESDQSAITSLKSLLNRDPKPIQQTKMTLFQKFLWQGNPTDQELIDPFNNDDQPTLLLSRYQPNLYKLIERFLYKPNSVNLPFINQIESLNLKAKKGLRVSNPKWQKKKFKKTNPIISNSSNTFTSNLNELNPLSEPKSIMAPSIIERGRLIVFVLGGITYPELKALYKLGDKYGLDLVIGSTHTITPNRFISQLKSLFQFKFEPVPVIHPDDIEEDIQQQQQEEEEDVEIKQQLDSEPNIDGKRGLSNSPYATNLSNYSQPDFNVSKYLSPNRNNEPLSPEEYELVMKGRLDDEDNFMNEPMAYVSLKEVEVKQVEIKQSSSTDGLNEFNNETNGIQPKMNNNDEISRSVSPNPQRLSQPEIPISRGKSPVLQRMSQSDIPASRDISPLDMELKRGLSPVPQRLSQPEIPKSRGASPVPQRTSQPDSTTNIPPSVEVKSPPMPTEPGFIAHQLQSKSSSEELASRSIPSLPTFMSMPQPKLHSRLSDPLLDVKLNKATLVNPDIKPELPIREGSHHSGSSTPPPLPARRQPENKRALGPRKLMDKSSDSITLPPLQMPMPMPVPNNPILTSQSESTFNVRPTSMMNINSSPTSSPQNSLERNSLFKQKYKFPSRDSLPPISPKDLGFRHSMVEPQLDDKDKKMLQRGISVNRGGRRGKKKGNA